MDPTPLQLLGYAVSGAGVLFGLACIVANHLRKAGERDSPGFGDRDERLERLCRHGEGARFSHSSNFAPKG